MKVFYHHIYEYRKGLRNLILHTISNEYRFQIEEKLQNLSIDYLIFPLSNGNMNVFFGAKECVDVIKAIGKTTLTDYTPEEDFILGMMLGYDRLKQCKRYLDLITDNQYMINNSLNTFSTFDESDEVGCLNDSQVLRKDVHKIRKLN